MKIIALSLILVNSLYLSSQNLEITGGINKNLFIDFVNDNHYGASYRSEYGYSFGMGIDDVKVDWSTYRFTLNFTKYSGGLEAHDISLGGGSITTAQIDKSILSMGAYPINFRIFKRMDLNLGVEFSILMDEHFKGTKSGWNIGNGSWNKSLAEEYKRYSAKQYFGLSGRLAYDIKITEKWFISPQYSYYFGLSREFIEFPEASRSMRHYYSLGLQRNLK